MPREVECKLRMRCRAVSSTRPVRADDSLRRGELLARHRYPDMPEPLLDNLGVAAGSCSGKSIGLASTAHHPRSSPSTQVRQLPEKLCQALSAFIRIPLPEHSDEGNLRFDESSRDQQAHSIHRSTISLARPFGLLRHIERFSRLGRHQHRDGTILMITVLKVIRFRSRVHSLLRKLQTAFLHS